MSNVTLQNTDITTSSIGFGCAGLMRTPTSKGRSRLLNTAFNSGIRHFDVARVYGIGQAEAELGTFIKSRRSEITIPRTTLLPLFLL